MARVFITQEVMVRSPDGRGFERKFDLTSAEQYGTLEVLIGSGQSAVSSVPVMRQLRERLAGFNDDDFLVMMGDPSIMAGAAMVASANNNGRVKLLKWDRRSARYIPVQLDISGKAL